MSKIEQELVKFSGYNLASKPRNRKDYQVSLALAAMQAPGEWDDLSTHAMMWVNQVLAARAKKHDIPEFPDVENEERASTKDNTEAAGCDTSGTPEVETAFEAGNENHVTEDFEAEISVPYPKVKKPRAPRPRRNLTGKFNRYGLQEGSRGDQVVKFFEGKGGTMSEFSKIYSRTVYNPLNRLKEDGHTVVKDPVTKIIRLIHKDDVK